MKKRRNGFTGDILLYILATVIFVFAAYIVAAAYGGWEGAPDSFVDRVAFILENINVLQVNEFTVIFVTLGLMIPQFFMVIILYSRISANVEYASPNGSKTADLETETSKEEINPFDLPTHVLDDSELKEVPDTVDESSNYKIEEEPIISDEITEEKESNVKHKEEKQDLLSVFKRSSQEEEEYGFDQETSLKMMNIGYSIDQIRAMMELKAYVSDVDANFLCKVFKKDMTPSMIHDRIEVFYG